MTESIVIKKHPIIIVRDLVALQFLATGGYFAVSLIGNYGEIYQGLNFQQVLSYEIARLLFLFIAELVLLGYAFLRWFFEAYVVYPDAVVHEHGFLFRRKDRRILPRPMSISCQYGVFSKLFRYGAIVIGGKSIEKPIVLSRVMAPEMYRKRILRQERNMNRVDFAENPKNVHELLDEEEREHLELKSSLRLDRHENKVNRELEKAALKTIAAFLNSEGGYLLLGVGDGGEIVGLEGDYMTLRKQNADGFENHFTNIFREVIGPEHRRYVKLHFHDVGGKEVCVMQVLPAANPAYMKFDNEEGFYIRTGNSTTALRLREVAPYIQSRWGK